MTEKKPFTPQRAHPRSDRRPRLAFTTPHLKTANLPDKAGGGLTVRTMAELTARARYPRLAASCPIVAGMGEVPGRASRAAAAAALLALPDWAPHHSAEALIDHVAPWPKAADNRLWQGLHIDCILTSRFHRLRGLIEQLLIRHAADLTLADLRRLAAWMNEDGHHPNPRGFFDQVQDRLPPEFVENDLPKLRIGERRSPPTSPRT